MELVEGAFGGLELVAHYGDSAVSTRARVLFWTDLLSGSFT